MMVMGRCAGNSLVTLDVDIEAELAAQYKVSAPLFSAHGA